MELKYKYTRLDGGTCECYGDIEENSNFIVAFGDEGEGVADIDDPDCNTWKKVCAYLEANLHPEIEQIEAC